MGLFGRPIKANERLPDLPLSPPEPRPDDVAECYVCHAVRDRDDVVWGSMDTVCMDDLDCLRAALEDAVTSRDYWRAKHVAVSSEMAEFRRRIESILSRISGGE